MTVDPVDVGEVLVVPDRVVVVSSGQAPLAAHVRDLDGNPLSDREVEWKSLDARVAAVGPDGVLTGMEPGVAVVTASVDGVVGVAQITVQDRDHEDDDDHESDDEGGAAPRAPSGLKGERRGPNRVDLTWRDRSEGEERFELQRRSTGGNWKLLARPRANEEDHRDRDVERDRRYEYRIRACNDAGCSGYSSSASVGPHGGGGGSS